MKPQEGKELRKQRSATAALKREIGARFGWLNGAPAVRPGAGIDLANGIRWVRFRKDGEIHPHTVTITESDVRLAVRSPGELRVQFPRALPKLVGDVDSWAAQRLAIPGLLRKLNVLPDILHSGSALPLTNSARHRAAQITNQHSNLRFLVSALLWRTPHDEKLVLADLRKLRKIAPALDKLLPTLAMAQKSDEATLETQIWMLRLAELAPPEDVNPFLDLIPHPGLAESISAMERISLDGAQSRVLNQQKPPKSVKDKNSVPEANRFFEAGIRLAKGEKVEARRFLRLFSNVYPEEHLEDLAIWWKRWRELQRSFKQLRKRSPELTSEQLNIIASNCRVLQDTRLKFPRIRDIEPLIRSMTRLPIYPLVARLLELVPSVLDGRYCGLELLKHWENCRPQPRVLRELERFLRFHPPARLSDFGPWAELIRGTRWFVPESIGNVLEDNELIPIYFDAIHALIISGSNSIETPAADGLGPIVRKARDPFLAMELFLAFEKAASHGVIEDWWYEETVLTAVLEQNTDPASVVETFKGFDRLSDNLYGKGLEAGLSILEKLRHASELELQKQLLEEADCKTLAHLTRLVTVADGSIPDLPVASKASAPWMHRYPAEFGEHLKALRSFLPNGEAQKRAAAILGKDFPDPEELQRELDHVLASSARAPSEKLTRRAAKLRGWIERPRIPSAVRLKNLERKLIAAVRQTRLEKWRSTIHEQASARLTQTLPGFQHRDKWLASPRLTPHVLGIAEMDKSRQRHPLWVLRHFDHYDFRNEPANRKFVARLEAKGLDLGPWLDGIGTQTFLSNEKASLHLSLEDDPLEILEMGQHFRTCLSPDGCNYFSVYANLSDINKRIVYGRTNGKVRSRCLLAISEEGTVLVFHPYSHESWTQFREAITAFAEHLAGEMGTVVTPQGTVANLVGPDWYDDGSIDVGSRFGFLREGSAFRNELAKIDPSQFRQRLFEEITTLDALTLPYLLHLDEFTQRPELVLPLFPEIQDNEEFLLVETLLRAAELGWRAGESDYSLTLLRRHGPGLLLREPNFYLHWSTLWMLAQHEPSRALKILKKLRPRGVRSWNNETDRTRLLAGAESYYQLRRPNMARQLFQKLADRDIIEDYHYGGDSLPADFVGERLAELS